MTVTLTPRSSADNHRRSKTEAQVGASHAGLDVEAAITRAKTYQGFLSGLSEEQRERVFAFTDPEVAGKAGMADR